MSKLKVLAFAVSLDGFGAGADQSLQNPMGVGGMGLHPWMLHTRTFAAMHGGQGGDTGIDDDWARRSFDHIGACTCIQKKQAASGDGDENAAEYIELHQVAHKAMRHLASKKLCAGIAEQNRGNIQIFRP